MKSDHEAHVDRQREKAHARSRAQRGHRGGGHWHVTLMDSRSGRWAINTTFRLGQDS